MNFEEVKNVSLVVWNYWSENGDPRTSEWFLTATMYPVLVITAFVIISVKVREINSLKNLKIIGLILVPAAKNP